MHSCKINNELNKIFLEMLPAIVICTKKFCLPCFSLGHAFEHYDILFFFKIKFIKKDITNDVWEPDYLLAYTCNNHLIMLCCVKTWYIQIKSEFGRNVSGPNFEKTTR